MISVKRLGHATLATPDIEKQADYWTAVMGLQVVHRSKDFVLLATKLGEEAIALEASSGTISEPRGVPNRAGQRSWRTC